MAVSGTVPSRGRQPLDPYRLARWIRHATLVATVAIGGFCALVYGTEWVPPGMRTVPGIEPGWLCVLDRRAAAATVGRDVFVRVRGVLLLTRVAAVDGDLLTVLNPDPDAPYPDSRAFGQIERAAVRGTVLFAIESGPRRRGG